MSGISGILHEHESMRENRTEMIGIIDKCEMLGKKAGSEHV